MATQCPRWKSWDIWLSWAIIALVLMMGTAWHKTQPVEPPKEVVK